jgi:hypothetical protein
VGTELQIACIGSVAAAVSFPTWSTDVPHRRFFLSSPSPPHIMSRFNGNSSGQQLWNAPITQARTQQQTQQQIQHENEQAWRRSQELQQGDQQPQDYDQYSEQEPVDYDIYNKAVSVSSPRLSGVHGDIDPQATIRKTVMRRVEVPFTRNVRVPTQVVKLVPTTVEQKVAVKRLVQVPGHQTVNESYIDVGPFGKGILVQDIFTCGIHRW